MGASIARLGIATAAIFVTLSSAALADPVAIVYRIDIYKQCEFVVNGETCREFHSSFPLTLTFDSNTFNEHGDDLDRTRFYGAPSVSDVPLMRRTDFPPVTEEVREAAERAQFVAVDGGWRRESSVIIRDDASAGGSDYHRDLSLIASGQFSSVPDLNGLSFAQFLATAPFHQFNVADSIELASGGFESNSYYGHVSLESAVVTPEPASLLLLGTGLAALAGRRRARARPN
jgi:hypothetical protein